MGTQPLAILVGHSGYQPGLDERIRNMILGSGKKTVILESAPFGDFENRTKFNQLIKITFDNIALGDKETYKDYCEYLVELIEDRNAGNAFRRSNIFQFTIAKALYKTGVKVKHETDFYSSQEDFNPFMESLDKQNERIAIQLIATSLGQRDQAVDAFEKELDESVNYTRLRDDVINKNIQPDEAIIIGYDHKIEGDLVDYAPQLSRLNTEQRIISELMSDYVYKNSTIYQPVSKILKEIAVQFTESDLNKIWGVLHKNFGNWKLVKGSIQVAESFSNSKFIIVDPQGQGLPSEDYFGGIGDMLIRYANKKGYLKPEIITQGKDLETQFKKYLKIFT